MATYEYYKSRVGGTPLSEAQWKNLDPKYYPYMSIEDFQKYGYSLPSGGGTTTPTTTPEPSYEPLPGQPGWGKTPEERVAAHELYISGGWGEGAVTPTKPPVTPAPPAPGLPVTPVFGEGAEVPAPVVTPAPPYAKDPSQIAFEEMYGGKLTDWVEAEGYGIPEETQAQMIQKQTDTLKAREEESLRVMRNNMERRGITNSGFIFANEQVIKSNTSVAIAGAIADVQIKSVLLKMASFEKAMGQAGQFLGYLSEQSQLRYAPEFATWKVEQEAKLQHWQGQMDILKIDLNAAYQTQNTILQAELQSEYAEQQHGYDIELAEMEIEANQQIATAQGAGSIFGTILGFLFGK